MEGKTAFTLAEIANILAVDLSGNAQQRITGLATLKSANAEQLSFLANTKYAGDLASTRAGAVILNPGVAVSFSGNALISANPYLTYAHASRLFEPRFDDGGDRIHPSAVVAVTAKLGEGVQIGANAVIGDGVEIGDGVVVGAGCVIGPSACLGARCLLHANVTLCHGVVLGDRVTLHSGVIIGSDGFGFAPSADGWVKIAQLGSVRIGSDVDIGANTTIDRGALDDTIIGNGVIIDNQVQIAHNVVIGDFTAIAGCTGIAGSTTIGKNCTLAGRSNIVGHITIADGTHITAAALITKSITEPGSYSSGTGMQTTKEWKKNAVRFGKLHDLYDRLVKLEKKIK